MQIGDQGWLIQIKDQDQLTQIGGQGRGLELGPGAKKRAGNLEIQRPSYTEI